ncbi:hypothetical protein WDW86_19725 [Bdellovibrionota bacterium FG-2]
MLSNEAILAHKHIKRLLYGEEMADAWLRVKKIPLLGQNLKNLFSSCWMPLTEWFTLDKQTNTERNDYFSQVVTNIDRLLVLLFPKRGFVPAAFDLDDISNYGSEIESVLAEENRKPSTNEKNVLILLGVPPEYSELVQDLIDVRDNARAAMDERIGPNPENLWKRRDLEGPFLAV